LRYPYNPKDQRIQVGDGIADRAFLGRFRVAAEDAVAASADGVLVAALSDEAQEITAGITSPAVPRSLSIVGNAAGIAGDVVVTGKNANGEEIEETIALNENNAVSGDKAFAEVTKVELPVQVHAPQEQTVTIEVTNACTTAGNLTVTISSALFEGGDEDFVVPVDDTDHDSATKVAAQIAAVLNKDETFGEHFEASNDGAVITIAAKEAAPNDDTMDIAVEPASTGVTVGESSDGDAGVLDIVSVGWGNKLGLPFKLAKNTVLGAFLDNKREGTVPTVKTDADNLENNTVLLNSALDGTVVDVYLIV